MSQSLLWRHYPNMQVHCVFSFCNTVSSRHRCPRSSYPCTLIEFTIGGRGRMASNGASEDFGPASVLVRQAHEVFWIEQDLVGDHVCLGIRGCNAERIQPGSYPQLVGMRGLAHDLRTLVREGGENAHLRIELLAGLAAVSLFERHPADAPRGPAQKAHAIIDAEFRSRLEIARVAQRVHVSAAHLREQFHATYGESPMSYLLARRLSRAKELLQDVRLPVGQVAELSGFRDPFYFSRQFRRLTNYTPTAWRAMAFRDGPRSVPLASRPGAQRDSSKAIAVDTGDDPE